MVLTTDYDGTLADDNHVSADVVRSLEKLKASGRRLILVTGRELEQLKGIFPAHILFDRIVAENGAVVYSPASLTVNLLAEVPPAALINLLKIKNVPFSIGHSVLATWEPYHTEVFEAIKEAGLEYQVIFNKGAVMVLPSGVNKATGLHAALKELNMHEHNAVAIGDAENDNAMLRSVECAVAVSNALPQVKAISDWTTKGAFGNGVVELVAELINNDLASLELGLNRHYLRIGKESDGSPVCISPYGCNILLSGSSSCGKTTLCAAFLEKLNEKEYQFCLIDPEGDYQETSGVITIGDENQPPQIHHVIQVLTQPGENVAVCLLAVPFDERPDFFRQILHAIADLREQTGHPHFIVMDEAHHLIPKDYEESFFHFPDDLTGVFAITTQPALLCRRFLKRFNVAMTMGESPENAMASFGSIIGVNLFTPISLPVHHGCLLLWEKHIPGVRFITGDVPTRLLMRHKRKYATGDMGMNSFYFRGPGLRLNLKANNLMLFMQMAAGVDDETWLFHLTNHDYSKWLKNSIKNPDLAFTVEKIENTEQNAESSRKAIFRAILTQYTASG